MHKPETFAKIHAKHMAWRESNSPTAARELERIRNLNPTSDPTVRAKISRTLKAMKHSPSVRGGNGTGLTEPQAFMMDALGAGWIAEFALSLGQRQASYPTHYKMDLANPALKIGIELDGNSHYARKAQDEKKDAKLASLGWTVLRFWNRDILNWRDAGTPMESSISMILAQHGIRVSR